MATVLGMLSIISCNVSSFRQSDTRVLIKDFLRAAQFFFLLHTRFRSVIRRQVYQYRVAFISCAFFFQKLNEQRLLNSVEETFYYYLFVGSEFKCLVSSFVEDELLSTVLINLMSYLPMRSCDERVLRYF